MRVVSPVPPQTITVEFTKDEFGVLLGLLGATGNDGSYRLYAAVRDAYTDTFGVSVDD